MGCQKAFSENSKQATTNVAEKTSKQHSIRPDMYYISAIVCYIRNIGLIYCAIWNTYVGYTIIHRNPQDN